MILAVFDTNVLVSALLTPAGNEADVLRAIRGGLVTPCIMKQIIDEYAAVLSRRKFSFAADEIEAVITLFSSGKFVQSEESNMQSPDPTDTKFLHCAFAASADFLVTGNRRHFPASPYGSTYVVSAGELLARITPDPPLSS